MAASSERDLNPTVEDYDSDQSEYPVLESFRRSPAANVAAKRSHPSDLGTEKPSPSPDKEKLVHIDLQSDSGYSSHTAGTMSSADSVPSAKLSQAPSTAPSSAASMPPSSPAASKRRPTVVAEDRKRSSQSPRKPLQRNGSVASKRPAGTRRPTLTTEDCTDPNCTKCAPNAPSPRPRRPTSTALDPGLDISRPPFDVRSQRSDPAPTYTSPPSPTYSRQPAPYLQGSTVVQPAQTRPRALSTTRRPMSYHGDPGPNYWTPGMPAPYPSPPQDYGPPPSMSAHYAMPQHQHHPQMAPFMMGATPPSQFYQGGHPMAQHMAQISPPYEQQRPSLSARTSSNSNYQTRRPVSGFGPPLVTHDNRPEQPMPSARYGNTPQSARQERFALTQTPHLDSESSDYESSSEEEAPPAPRAPPPKQLMPPPKMKSKSKQEPRPALRHAKTTQVTQVYNNRGRRESMSRSATLPERPREKDNRTRISTVPPSRSVSVSRPGPPKRVTQSAYDTPRARVVVENPRTSRRQSYQAYEQAYEDDYDYEQEERRRRRNSRVYRDEGDDAILVSERPPRRRTDASIKRDEYTETRKVMDDVEAYQQRTRGSYEPLSEHVHKVAKQRASRVPSDPDRKTRISQSARTTLTNGNGNGEIRLRVDASAPLSLSFNGDMEGRTLRIDPAEDGMADIVIGGHRGEDDSYEDDVYRSERDSIMGNRKSMIAGAARRDAEEASIKSGRSSQGRRERIVEGRTHRERDGREEERRPLRRQTQTRYY